MNRTVEKLLEHRSIRKYKNIYIDEDKIMQIIQAAQCSSTSSHFQAYTIIRVNDYAKRSAIAAAAGNQKWVINAPVFLVFCADLHRAKKYWVAKDDKVFSNNEMFIVSTVDAALAAQQAFIAAESMGLSGVYIVQR